MLTKGKAVESEEKVKKAEQKDKICLNEDALGKLKR
jgi:hypothetical protein